MINLRKLNKICDLDSRDKIFGIKFNPKSSKYSIESFDIISNNRDGEDYCYYLIIDYKKEHFNYAHEVPKEREEKHYFLFNLSNYKYFFTLKPKTWEEDLKEEFEYLLNENQKLFKEKEETIKNEVNVFLEGKEKINEHINIIK
jgi:hypothetical protein